LNWCTCVHVVCGDFRLGFLAGAPDAYGKSSSDKWPATNGWLFTDFEAATARN